MHTKFRTFHTPDVLAILALVSVLSVAGSLHATLPEIDVDSNTQERAQQVDELDDAISNSASATRSVWSVHALRAEGEEELKQAKAALQAVGRGKRDARLALADAFAALEAFKAQYGVDPTNDEALAQFAQQQRKEATSSLRFFARARFLLAERLQPGVAVLLTQLLDAPFAARVEESLRYRALSALRLHVFADVQEVLSFSAQLAVLRTAYEGQLASYHAALSDVDAANAKIAMSDQRLAEIKRIVAAVEERIRQMQSQLAAYDERIRERAEGALIAKGLLSGRSALRSPQFLWPAVGRITATFLDPSYEAYFGVPHKAIDIAQLQGSPIRCSADGVVHYVRDGGQSGYSYILIGHRSGYATLYGHVLESYVRPGEDVDSGQVIGLSGGIPGTPGSGPMTTGAHVHFEVIKDGVHLNPLRVLP